MQCILYVVERGVRGKKTKTLSLMPPPFFFSGLANEQSERFLPRPLMYSHFLPQFYAFIHLLLHFICSFWHFIRFASVLCMYSSPATCNISLSHSWWLHRHYVMHSPARMRHRPETFGSQILTLEVCNLAINSCLHVILMAGISRCSSSLQRNARVYSSHYIQQHTCRFYLEVQKKRKKRLYRHLLRM